MYNFRVVSYEGKQQITYNFEARSYRRKVSDGKDELEIYQIQDTIDEDQCSTMTIDFNSGLKTSVYVMNDEGKTIDSITPNNY